MDSGRRKVYRKNHERDGETEWAKQWQPEERRWNTSSTIISEQKKVEDIFGAT